MKKNIYIVGYCGRTGAMLGRELGEAAKIIGVAGAREAELAKSGRIKIQRGAAFPEILAGNLVLPEDFEKAAKKEFPDFIWLAVRNPVAAAAEFYYKFFRGRKNFPVLVLSQNGLSAIDDARSGLVKALGHDADKVEIIRVNFINGVDLKEEGGSPEQGGTLIFNYRLPIKLGFASLNGKNGDFKKIIAKANIKFREFGGEEVFKMENSKLFTNLIGMAAASRGMTVSQGLLDREVFAEEIGMLREYVLAAEAAGGGFAQNFAGYPIKMLAKIIFLPWAILMPLRPVFEMIVSRGRNRPKDLAEIDYYNGEAVKMGKRWGILTPINEKIIARAKNRAKQI